MAIVGGTALLCSLVASADPDADRFSLSLALLVAWSTCLALFWCSAFLTCWRWRVSREDSAGWMAAGALSGATYVTSCTLRLYVGSGTDYPPPAAVHIDAVMMAVWLILGRQAVKRTHALPESGPIWLGVVLGGIGAALGVTAMSVPDPIPTVSGALTRALVGLLGLVAAIGLLRVRRISRPMRRDLLLICCFGTIGRVAAPLDPTEASVWAALAVTSAIIGAAILLRLTTMLLVLARGRAEALHELATISSLDASASEQIHELRASFAGVASAVRLLAEHEVELPEVRRADVAGMLREELDRLERLLSGQPADAVSDLDLDAVLRTIVIARRLTGQHVAWQPSGCHVEASPDLIGTAVNMLLVNAEVHAPGSNVRVSAVSQGSAVHIRVTDDGPGVAEGVRERLFARGIRDESSPGHGIGLSFARRLATAQGGSLALATGRPGSTTFEITVPGSSTSRKES